MTETPLAVSLVVPLYNEEAIVSEVILTLLRECERLPFASELVLCENGSRDRTREIAAELAAENPSVRLIVLSSASYGAAIRAGIRESRSDVVIIFNADLWSMRFVADAMRLIGEGTDIVVASKCLAGSDDERPLVRRLITRSFNAFLRVVFGFRGTDTHGMKAMRRSTILPVIAACVTSKEVFDTELVLRAEKDGLRIREVPTQVRDHRPPRLSLLKRVPSTIGDLVSIRATLPRAVPHAPVRRVDLPASVEQIQPE